VAFLNVSVGKKEPHGCVLAAIPYGNGINYGVKITSIVGPLMAFI
jgi:hypothetical protein